MKKVKTIFRSLRKNSGITIINIVSMALGLVSTGIILGYVFQEFNYDSENSNSERIYRLIQKEGEIQQASSYAPLGQELKSEFPEIENAIRVSFFYGYMACSTQKNKFNENSVIFADPEFLEMFSFPLIKGNVKECLSSPNSIVISESAASKYFGNDNPLGENMQLGEEVFTVTGIFQNFNDNSNFKGDLILPLAKISKLTQIWIEPSWDYESEIHTFVLLTNNNVIESLSVKARNFISKYISESKTELLFQPLSNIHVNKKLDWESTPQVNVKYLYILLIVALLILCVSITNFLFLYIGTAEQRTTEIGIKKVFGASRTVLFFDYLIEILILILFSVLIAILLYVFYDNYLVSYLSFAPNVEFLDFKFILGLVAIIISVTLLAGFYPSLILSSQKPVNLFSPRANYKTDKILLINILVIGQFTLCISLIAFTILMHKQTNYMANRNTGFATDELISIPLNMKVGKGIYNEKFELFADELKKYPSIKNVSLSFSSPSAVNTYAEDVNWIGKKENMKLYMNWESVSFDYFKTIGINIIKGRSFSRDFSNDELNRDSRRCAYILNQCAIKEMEITDPIGKEFEVWGLTGPIVGIVEDYNFKSMHTGIGPVFYMINPIYFNEIIIRFDPKVSSISEDIDTVWNKFVPDYPIEVKYVKNQVLALYQNDQKLAKIMNAFSILTILISCSGLFTLTVLSMNRRTKEIGIRKVNGAQPAEIIMMFFRTYIKFVFLALGIATPITWFAIHKWLENFSYKTDVNVWPVIFSGLLVLIIALLTVSWKAWQTAYKNPIIALRHE